MLYYEDITFIVFSHLFSFICHIKYITWQVEDKDETFYWLTIAIFMVFILFME